MPKTLIINGSPRKNGDTMAFINTLSENITGEVKIFNTYTANVSPCVDCRNCNNNSYCTINDEFQDFIEYLDCTDNVVIASPLYFSELTGSMLQFFSRLQYIWISKTKRNNSILSDKERRGIVMLVGGGSGDVTKALETAKLLLKTMNVTFVDSVVSHNTDNLSAKDDIKALDKIKDIAHKIND